MLYFLFCCFASVLSQVSQLGIGGGVAMGTRALTLSLSVVTHCPAGRGAWWALL